MQITIRRTLMRLMKPALLAAAIATTFLQPARAQDSGTADPSKPAVPPLPEVLIKDASQLHSNAHNTTNNSSASDDDLATLIDDSNSAVNYSYWISDTEGTCTDPQYLRVDLGEGFKLAADEDIVVYTTRHKEQNPPTNLNISNFGKKLHPTAFHVEVSRDGVTWEPFADPDTHVYFTYRGPGTKEFSARIHTDKTFRYIRFTVTANNSKTLNKGTQYRSMCISHFQLLKVKKDSGAIYFFNTEPGKEMYLTDRFHLNTDLRPDYADYEFVNTRGIFDLHKLDHYDTADNPKDFCDWDACWDENGIWKKDLLTLAKYGIDMPKYSWVTGAEDPLVKEGKRQRTHVIEHTYYAVPGDAVALVPYYEMPTRMPDKYDVSYAHWYDYETGGHLVDPTTGARLLDFLVDPRDIYYSKNHGYFAGIGFPRESHYDKPETGGGDDPQPVTAFEIATVDDFLEFVEQVKTDKLLDARLTADLDFSGYSWEPDQFPKIEKYAGTFDGQSHVIKNLHYTANNGGVAFISSLGIQSVNNKTYAGSLRNIIFDENCSFTNTTENAWSNPTAAIIGTLPNWGEETFVIQGVINKATLKAQAVSGIIGNWNSTACNVEIRNCAVTGTLKASGFYNEHLFFPSATIFTTHGGKSTISNCWTVTDAEVETRNWNGDPETYTTNAFYYSDNNSVTVTNCYSNNPPIASIKQIPTDPASLNTEEFVGKLNGGKPGYWAVSTEDGDGAGAYPYPYVRLTLPGESPDNPDDPVDTYDDSPGSWVWADADGKPMSSDNPGSFYTIKPNEKGSGNAGTYATFFFPRSPYAERGELLGLPKEYTIAADFSYSFNVKDPSGSALQPSMDANLNIDYTHRKIYEPELCYRHIFHIKDGRQFAEEMSGSHEKNQEYLVKTRRYITALTGTDFNVRLDAGMPIAAGDGWDARSRFYYKISNSDYRRVAGCKVVTKKLVTNADGIEEEQDCMWDDATFSLGKEVLLVGSRTLDDKADSPRYYACGGNQKVYRMLGCGTPTKAGKYVVRLVAQDVNGNILHPYDPEHPDNPLGDVEHDLIVREFIIEFIDPAESNVGFICNEQELINKTTGSEPDLTERFGAPYTTINNDEYLGFNNMLGDAAGFPVTDYLFHPWQTRFGGSTKPEEGEKYYALKWPLPRYMCEYGSTLGRGHNYCTYRIAQHSSVVEWKGAVNRGADSNYNVAPGLFDRHFYESGSKIQQDMAAAAANGEEYTGPTEPEPGYFYWINASSDPDVTCRLNVGQLCHGATLHVSAWVATFNGPEQANVSFNFIAVMKDGTRERLHSFITGPIKYPGEWCKVYYNFTPELSALDIDASQIDHYEIELDNNASSSEGADYAIDNVQVYIMRADVKAQQLNFPCADQNSVIDMKIYAPFDNLLRIVDLTPATSADTAKPVNMYYSFVNKAVYDKLISEGKTTDEAYDRAVVKGCYGVNPDNVSDADSTFGKLTFDTFYDNLKPYADGQDGTPIEYNVPMGYEDPDTKIKYFAFNCWVKDADMHVGNQYYVLLCNDPTGAEDFVPKAENFDISNDCSSKSTIVIEGNSKIKVDGYPIGPNPSLQRCENESPVIQLDLVGLKVGDTQYDSVINNAPFDWYSGRLAQFYLESNEDGTILLHEALAKFRESYPDATSAIQECTEQYTEPIREYLVKVTTTRDGKAPILFLHQHSYIYPDTHIPEGMDSYEYYVSAIPCVSELDMTGLEEVCVQPVEVKLTVDRHTPRMKSGLTGITSYPDYINDAPLRTGLKQIRKATATKARSADAEFTLDFPIRFVSSTIKEITKMVIKETKDGEGNSVRDDEVYLTQTNDPQYKNLQPFALWDDDTETADADADDSMYESGLWAVGRLVELKADVSTDGSVRDNMARIVFYKNDPSDTETRALNFKEGYYYRFAVPYMEEVLDGVDYVPACPGRQIVTLKIVPEYMRWTGDGSSLNWNNDMHWERVDTKGLYATDADKTNDNALDDFITDGSNNMPRSYSPAPFTKVIMPAESSTLKDADNNPLAIEDPYLYGTDSEQISVYTREGEKSMTWTSDPEDKAGDSPAGLTGNLLELMKKAVTYDINYDMVAFEGGNFLGCGPWQAHVCDQIDFMPKAGISNQQYLTYNKAWVEFEMTPGRWYTLSSPLAETLAGDMYMPTANSRQETLRFSDITYDPKLNNRFAPAVFQRNWNAANATLFHLPAADGGNGTQENVAVATTWSHVYNDVLEKYEPGEGFSIYTDDSRVAGKPEKVLMRLPKADTDWYYYDIDWTGPDNNTTESGIHGNHTETGHTAEANYRLNSLEDGQTGTMTGTAAGNSRYYLFGNPFMAPLNMAKLLEMNADKIKPVYWIMADNTVEAASVFGKYTYTNQITGAEAKVSPLQGFFVELKEGYTPTGNKLELTYDNSTMLRTACGGNPLRKPGTRSGSHTPSSLSRAASQSSAGSLSRSEAEAEVPGLVLEALRNDTVLSRSLIVTDMNASAGYGDEDAPLMIDRQLVTAPLVYSLAGHQAAVINVTDDIDGTGIGVVTDDPTDRLTIRLSNVAEAEDCVLMDIATGESEPIYEDMEIPVTGSTNGRYYITRGGTQDGIRAIHIERNGNTVTVSTGRQDIRVEVFDTLGVHTASHQADAPQVSFTLPSGVYVLKADDGTERKTAKLIIR